MLSLVEGSALLTCHKCSGFVDNDGNGRLLPCLHVICGNCLKIMGNDKDESIRCEKCCLVFNMSQLEETCLSSISSEFLKNRCTVCSEKNPAEFKCEDAECGDLLCAVCERAHRRVKMTKTHSIVPLRTSTSIERCLSHENFSSEFFCATCNINFCKMCLIERRHAGHAISTALPEIVFRTLDSLSNSKFFENLDTLSNHMNQIFDTVTDKLRHVDECESGWRREMDATVKVIELMCQAKRSPYITLKQNAEKLHSLISQARLFLETVIKSTKENDFVLQRAWAVLQNSRNLMLKLSRTVQMAKENVSDVSTLPIPNYVASAHLRDLKMSNETNVDFNNASFLRYSTPNFLSNYCQPNILHSQQNQVNAGLSNVAPPNFAQFFASRPSSAGQGQPPPNQTFDSSRREIIECPFYPNSSGAVPERPQSFGGLATFRNQPPATFGFGQQPGPPYYGLQETASASRTSTPLAIQPQIPQPVIQYNNSGSNNFWPILQFQAGRFDDEIAKTNPQNFESPYFNSRSLAEPQDQTVLPNGNSTPRADCLTTVWSNRSILCREGIACDFCYPKSRMDSCQTSKSKLGPKKRRNISNAQQNDNSNGAEVKKRKPMAKRKNFDLQPAVPRLSIDGNSDSIILSYQSIQREQQQQPVPPAISTDASTLFRQDSEERPLVICEDMPGNLSSNYPNVMGEMAIYDEISPAPNLNAVVSNGSTPKEKEADRKTDAF